MAKLQDRLTEASLTVRPAGRRRRTSKSTAASSPARTPASAGPVAAELLKTLA